MGRRGKPVVILLADDDEDDYLLIRDSLRAAHLANEVRWVKDGEELMGYLLHQGAYKDHDKSPSPCLILLDLNMPRKDGREALKEIKMHPQLQHIPVVVLTTSKSEEDIIHTYNLGVNSFIRKPVNFEQFVEVMKTLGKYWFEIVELPSEECNE